jgi:DNA repair ATPase RecN
LTAKPPLERVQESSKFLERLMLQIPGFRGYKTREQRREADRIVRDYIYRVLESSRDNLMTAFEGLNESKVSELMQPMNKLVAKLDRVAEKINHASYGYSGFFDSIKIDEPQLNDMLSYDTQLMDLARKFSDATSSFRDSVSQGNLESAQSTEKTLESSVRELEEAFDHRRAVIEGVKV